MSIVGLAALVTAGLGAVAVGQAQQSAETTTAASTETVSADPLRVEADRRARVTRVSRDYTRTSLRADSVAQARAQRSAARRARSLRRLATAAEQRSAEIKEARERRRRLQRQRERERRREAARQRRIEQMNTWVVPVSNYEITATFGAGGSLWSSDHTGLDFAAAEGTPVGSAASGTVTFTGWDGAYGNKVVVTHEDGTETWYCHLSSITVGSGQAVGAGTTIGTVGSTGNSTGPHLHMEVRPGGGGPTDPYSFLQSKGAF